MSSSESLWILWLLWSWWLLLCVSGNVVHSSELPWIRLTTTNFSSDIHTHPFVLCLATVPWCGESRSIMRELSESLANDETLHSLIQLRIVYIHLDKGLGRFFFKKERFPSFTFFWHSTPLKYKGKVRLQNILTGVHRAVLFNPWDLPLKKLETALQLDRFMESTDKAVILFDFCNNIDKIHKSKHHQVVRESRSVSPVSGDVKNGKMKTGTFDEGCETIVASQRLEESQKLVLDAEEVKAVLQIGHNVVQEDTEVSPKSKTRDDNGLSGMSLGDQTKDSSEYASNSILSDFVGNENDVRNQAVRCESETELSSASSQSLLFGMKIGEEDRQEKGWSMHSSKSGVLTQVEGCNRTEHRGFANVYQSLIKIARAYMLTPELADFAVIDNKRLLSRLGIDQMQNITWFLMQWMADRQSLPQMYDESQKLESFLFGSKQLVSELTRENIDTRSNFCNKMFSVILFVDKVSHLPDVRSKSWQALMALRTFVRNHVKQDSLDEKVSTSTDFKTRPQPDREGLVDLVKTYTETQGPKDTGTSLKSLFHQTAVVVDLPIKVSKNLPSKDLSVLSQTKGSSHNVMFKLLIKSDDEMQIDTSLSKQESKTLDFTKLLSSEDNYPIKRVQEGTIVGPVNADSVSSSIVGLGSLLSSNFDSFVGLKYVKGTDTEKRTPSAELIDEQLINDANHGSTMSFYFADGEDQWKDMVQPDLPYPSLVILDCLKGGMFILPNQSIDYLSLSAFFDQFENKKLQKAYLSEIGQRKPRKQVQVPFVNRDFHEVDGVPRLTAGKLLQYLLERQIVGHFSVPLVDSTEDQHQFGKTAALVLFTTPSCGFCKRMELVFREVHQLLNHDLDKSLAKSFLSQNVSTFDEDNKDAGVIGGIKEVGFRQKLPRLFQLDCTLNDCSLFFEAVNQEELYPSVILYPAQNEDPPMIFKGQATVEELLRFIAIEGEADTTALYILQGGTWKKRPNMTAYSQTGRCYLPQSSQSIMIDSSSSSSSSSHAYHFTADTTERQSSLIKVGDDTNQKGVKPIVYPTVGSVLLATYQLSKVSKTFESTKILIVKADGQEGFQGLIFNKPLAWNRLQGLDSEVKPLVNKTVLCYGGPVIVQGEPFVSLSRLKDVEGFTEVIPGVYVGDPSATMHVLQAIKEARLEAADFWFFLGHAVWGWQQLLNEIEQEWWNLTSYEEGTNQLPVQEWLGGSTVGVSDLLGRRM